MSSAVENTGTNNISHIFLKGIEQVKENMDTKALYHVFLSDTNRSCELWALTQYSLNALQA